MPDGGIPFDTGLIFLVAALFFALAVLYSSVGHAGASGYLAVMALFGVPPEMMRPVALTLNTLVASLTTFRFTKAGYLSWPDLWPLVLFSVPAAFAGGHPAVGRGGDRRRLPRLAAGGAMADAEDPDPAAVGGAPRLRAEVPVHLGRYPASLSSSSVTASPIRVQLTSVMPGCMMSPVRRPDSNTFPTACSTRSASSAMSKE